MEQAQLCKSAYNNPLQQSIYLCHKRKMSQIWQVNTLRQSPFCTPTPPNQCPYKVTTFYTLWNQKINPDKILKLMVTMTKSNVKSRLPMTLHTYNLQPMSLPSINFLHPTVSKI